MSKRSASLAVATVVLVVLVCIALFAPLPYVIFSPGPTENTLGSNDGKPVISIKGHKTYDTSGRLDLTTVSETRPDYHPKLPEVLSAWWNRDQLVLPRDVVYPPDQSIDQVEKESATQMLSSQDSAIAAGLTAAGFDVVKVTVKSVEEDSPAEGLVEPGDQITAVDGTKVKSTEDVVTAIRALKPGTTVDLQLLRNGVDKTVPVTTVASTDDPSQSRVGVVLSDAFDPPFKVTIRLGQKIGGPSAGLVFSLGIYDLLTPGQLTGGAFIAGTGTIDAGGNVGPIGGIQQKMAAAQDKGATIFLVPSDDCAEAVKSAVADDMELLKVGTINEAITSLKALDRGNDAAVTRCAS